ncbi:MAG: TIGR04282 family arsenosugar biosynthesis glycosyltransferase [Casimicrobiaceae bacterium]
MQIDTAVFARAPVAGEAKSRLIPRLGAEGAAALQHTLMRRSLRTALSANLGPVSLWCTPHCEHPAFIACSSEFDVPLFAQQGADLGARMFNAFAELGRRGRSILIGTDCPALTASDLRAAAGALLQGHDAVFIPAEDGGYVLIGLGRPMASLFDSMPWGSNQVMAETRLRLRHEGAHWLELPASWDVDRPEDYARLEASGFMQDTLALPR